MKISVPLPSQKTRGTKEVTGGLWLDTPRGKGVGCGAEVVDATRFAEAAKNEKPTSKDLEEKVNRRHNTIMQWEKERSGLPRSVKKRSFGFLWSWSR